MKRTLFCIYLTLLSSCLAVYSQETVAQGVVYDKTTGETIPFASVVFTGSIIGNTTNENGAFELKSTAAQDSLEVSVLGYDKKYIAIHAHKVNTLDVRLEEQRYGLDEIVIKPTENPSHPILRAIEKNRNRNNTDKYNAYNYKKYTKWEYRLINLPLSITNSIYFKSRKGVFRQQPDSLYYLPIYFSEEISKNEFQNTPPLKRTTLLAKKQSSLKFLDDLQLSGYTASLDAGYNFYDNYIAMYGKNFVSPLASNGLFYYKYYLTDSINVDGVMHYIIEYKPKRPLENVFYGSFEVESKYYSVTKLNAKVSSGANLNFIRQLELSVKYKMLDDSIPFFARNSVTAVIDYYPGNDSSATRMSLYTRLVNAFDSVDINPSKNLELASKRGSYEKLKSVDYNKHTGNYWETQRLEQLSAQDLAAYSAIDTINNIPLVKQLDLLAQMSLTGYYDMGKFEIGPYLSMLTFNQIEGCHVFFGGRSSEEISENFQFWGGVGYGFRDAKFKENIGIGYKFKTPTRKILQMYFTNDIVRIGGSDRILYLYENRLTPSEDNLISALANRIKVNQLMYEKRFDLMYENEWYMGYSTTLKLSLRDQSTPLYYPFLQQGKPIDRVYGAELSLDNRFSHKERMIEKGMRRLYLTSQYPVLHVMMGLGYTKVGNETHIYSRLHTTLKQEVFFGQTALKYAVEAGVILGTAPYTFLETPRGNQNYGYYKYNFNLMNNLTYINDTYAHVYADYHLNGFLLNRVPLFRRLKFREVLTLKAMIGDRRSSHEEYLSMPTSVIGMGGKPYVEAGVGLENVFKFFRIDGIARIMPQGKVSQASSSPFGIRGTFRIDF